jgi:hypothetical protein
MIAASEGQGPGVAEMHGPALIRLGKCPQLADRVVECHGVNAYATASERAWDL